MRLNPYSTIIEKRNNQNNSNKRKVLWMPSPLGEKSLHKMADLEVLRQLARRKYDVYVTATTSREKPLFQIGNSQVHVISIPLKSVPLILPVMRTVLLFFLLPIYIITLKPNFIIEVPDVSILSFIPTLVFSKLNRVKFVLDIRSIPVETFGFRGFMVNFWFIASVLVAKNFFDGMTIITSSMKKEVCTKFHINPKNIGVWTSGVSTRLFDPSKYIPERSKLRRKLGLSAKFVVFYHGVFSATRGLTQTVEAMKLLKDSNPNIILFLLGTGPIVSELRSLILKENLQRNVIIHNAVDRSEVPKLISMCDVCIVPLPNHPYWRFQSPLKLLEYLAMEKAVIVTDIPAHRSIIGENKCGLYISSVNPMKIAKAIEYAYINNADLEKWGKIGRKIVKEKYTWEKVAMDLDNWLLSIGKRAN